jgi:two-component system response regulator PilR (NtrC family)
VLRRLIGAALRCAPAGRDCRRPPTAASWRLLGTSAQMQEIRALIAKLARNQAPVFISGESGTGKELAARLIHEQGPRADGAFVPSTAAPSPQRPDGERALRPRKGSFTGAVATSRACSRRPTAAPCSSTRSPTCRCRCRSSCCA